jgi:hypothetical protein
VALPVWRVFGMSSEVVLVPAPPKVVESVPAPWVADPIHFVALSSQIEATGPFTERARRR